MILSLHIENIAVVRSLDIDMRRGFTVLSGETGAGKSIIVDCLGLLSGARADRDMIRNGEKQGEVSAVFADIGEVAANIISELGFSVEDGTVMLSRTLNADSASQARVNGRAVTLSVLREISAALFNIHGQNDNQKLLDRKNHLELLDRFAGCEGLLAEYGVLYERLCECRREIESFNRDAMELNRTREMLEYQIADIDAVKLRVGEEEALIAESKRLQSIERIKKHSALVERALSGTEKGVGAVYLIDRAATALSQLSDASPEAQELSERLNDIKYELDDIAHAASLLGDISDEDPTARIDKIEGRLEFISRLKRKYGATVEDILAYREDAGRRLDMIENSDEEIEKLNAELKQVQKEAKGVAMDLRRRRLAAANELTEKVVSTLEFLDMPKVEFDVSLEPEKDFSPGGLDFCEFMISANPGEPLMPMAKIASGGELARIMLSLKSVLNECDGIDTAIFDEIDTGISGKTSRKVGIKLREISHGTQVICVTHSAQIASLANNHLFISKSEIDGRVQTAIRELDEDGRVEEIARILGGIEISDIQRSAAREMIEEGKRL
ncbi:MAG: DNA repair protein RecN [Clostridia bacterium]|nr:DNA repair protein RecN [Clostridia bacterium]